MCQLVARAGLNVQEAGEISSGQIWRPVSVRVTFVINWSRQRQHL